MNDFLFVFAVASLIIAAFIVWYKVDQNISFLQAFGGFLLMQCVFLAYWFVAGWVVKILGLK